MDAGNSRQKLSRAALEELLFATAKAPNVTIYMPTHKAAAPPLMHEDQVRFKNLSARALDALETNDETETRLIDAIKNHLAGTQTDVEFWKHQTEGLLVCVNPDRFAAFNLPIDCDEYAAVGARFHLAPAVGLLDFVQPFYVLNLARKKPILLEGDMYGLRPSKIDLPDSVRAVLNIDEWKQGNVQSHSIAGDAGAQWHGQGGAKDRGAEELRIFLKAIDQQICDKADTSRPLILAGTEEIVAELRQLTKYPRVMAGHIANHAQPEEALEAARHIIYDEVISKKHKKLADTLAQNPALVPASQPELEDAVENSKISTLLLGLMQNTADTVRETHDQPVIKLTFPPDEQTERLDYLAATTLRLGGEVVTLDKQLTDPRLAAALLRY